MRGSLVLAMRHGANHGGGQKEEGRIRKEKERGGGIVYVWKPTAECITCCRWVCLKSVMLMASLRHLWSSVCHKSEIPTDDNLSEYDSDTEWIALMYCMCNEAGVWINYSILSYIIFGISGIVVGCPLGVEQVQFCMNILVRGKEKGSGTKWASSTWASHLVSTANNSRKAR